MVEVFCMTEAKKSLIVKLISVFLMLCCLAMVAYSFLTGTLTFFIVFLIFISLWFYLTFKYSVEYEVAYFDGEFRFAKIISKSRRKKMDVFTVEELVQIAPVEDRSVSNYLRDGSARKVDLTSGTDAASYAIVRRNSDRTIVYLVELDEKFLNEVARKNASKVKK